MKLSSLSLSVEQVSQLVRVNPQIEVGHHTSDVLAIKVVVGLVDVSHAPVGVVVAVGASAEGSLRPLGFRLPMVVVVAEAVHLHISLAVVVALQLPPRLSLFFSPS